MGCACMCGECEDVERPPKMEKLRGEDYADLCAKAAALVAPLFQQHNWTALVPGSGSLVTAVPSEAYIAEVFQRLIGNLGDDATSAETMRLCVERDVDCPAYLSLYLNLGSKNGDK